jgi:uncharacterized membrane protein YdjX (TVP38/TMEM64 family)
MTKKQAKNYVSGLLFLVVLVLVGWIYREQVVNFIELIRDKEAIGQLLSQIGVWGPLVFLLLLAVQVVTALLPAHGLMVAAGYLYGFFGGALLNLIGIVIASQLAFLLARYAGQSRVRQMIPDGIRTRWEPVVKRQGLFFFTLIFWFPVIPSNITNYIGGISPISFWAFLAASFVGRLPGVLLITAIGAYGLELSLQQWGLVGLLGILLIFAGRAATSRLEQRFAA